jgi:HAD superfamily hydrolase (TIGR01509 family)
MISTVIFDMDGVLINSEPVHRRHAKEMFAELGLVLTPEVQQTLVGRSALDTWKYVIDKYDLDETPEGLLKKSRGKYLKVLIDSDEVQMVDGARSLIDRLENNGFHLLLASSATSVTITEVLRKWNMKDTFPLFIGGDMVHSSKPNPEIFLQIAELAQVKPEECVVIEDAAHGVTAANNAGMKSIGFRNKLSGKQNLTHADVVVEDLEEITINMLRKL